jgi:hypothetical protein
MLISPGLSPTVSNLLLFKTVKMKKMKSNQFILLYKTSLLFFLLLFFSKIAISQTDTTIKPVPDTTIKPVAVATDSTKSEKKKKSTTLLAYAGATFNHLSMASADYETHATPGWSLGIAYKRGNFFYWQVGARYDNAIYELKKVGQAPDTIPDKKFSVKNLDVPLTAGINLLSATQRLLGLRLFLSAVPSFVLDVDNTDYPGYSKSDTNGATVYGQAGLGIDVLFLSIDLGYNYGFSDVFREPEIPGHHRDSIILASGF